MLITFLLLANVLLFLNAELKTSIIVVTFETLTALFLLNFLKNKYQKNTLTIPSAQSVNSNNDDRQYFEIIQSISSPIFVLNNLFEVVFMNDAATKLFGKHDQISITSIIRDLSFIEKMNRYKKDRTYDNFIWEKLIPSKMQMKAELKLFKKNILLNVTDLSKELLFKQEIDLQISSLTHELKTPLSVIIGYLETLDLQINDEKENSKYLEIIKSKAFELKHLIDQTLKLNELNSQTNEMIKVSVFEITNKIINNFENLFIKKNIQVQKDIDSISSYNILFTPGDLEIVLSNLFTNAINYSNNNSTISVIANLNALHELESLSIVDQGIGIAKEDLSKITQKFYRVDESRNNIIRGHGLGLTIVNQILNKNGYKLEFTSKLGVGSCFTIKF